MSKQLFLDILFFVYAVFTLISQYSEDAVVILDVGQGDSIFIQKGNFQMLIDGGEDISVLYEISKYMGYEDMNIEVVVLTHPHSDHLGGLFEIFERYEIGEVWINPIEYDSDMYDFLLEMDLPFKEIDEGEIYEINDWRVEVLFSGDEIYGKTGNLNNASIVLELTANEKKFLFMGDAEIEVEEYLLEKNLLEDINVLKAGHHCSKTASSDAFLDIVKPEVAVCSYGAGNSFGHPHDETIQNFVERNILILSTEEKGNVWVL
ncbi:MBL fold metallo-hydrolase [Candidatus Microgenomates bacterium]|nr:MBL fold metallo-hydrolase [Candidatus Microgenomates bacterium]